MTEVDVIVVGSGPAGLAAAAKSASAGHSVVILERETEPGGVPRHCANPSFGVSETGWPHSGPSFARRMVKRALAAGAELHTSTTVLDLDPELLAVKAVSPGGESSWTGRALILATGARERPRHARRIPGSRAGGIMTTGELQQHTNVYGRRVGERAVVYGAEHVSFSALMTLKKAGIEPVAVVTSQPTHQTFTALKMYATRFGRIPLHTSHTIASIEGAGRVTGVWLYYPGWGAWPGGDGPDSMPGETESIHRRQSFVPCDTVIVTGDWVAEGDLAVRSGLDCDVSNGGIPYVTSRGVTSATGVFAAGAMTHPGESAGRASRSGHAAGAEVIAFLGGANERQKIPVVSDDPALRWVHPRWVTPGSRTKLRFRVDAWLDHPRVIASQGDRRIDSKRFRRTMPGRTYSLPTDWVARMDPGTPVKLSLIEND